MLSYYFFQETGIADELTSAPSFASLGAEKRKHPDESLGLKFILLGTVIPNNQVQKSFLGQKKNKKIEEAYQGETSTCSASAIRL